jgi:curved DNA-binding protein
MDYQDYYETLGVARTASQAEIKKAFRRLAREHHPDTKPGDASAERRFKQVNEANAVLSDPEKRKKYDLLGANWEQYSRAGAAPGGAGAGNPFAGFGRSGQQGNVRYEFHSTGDAGGFSDFFRTFFSEGEPATEPTGPGRGRRQTGGHVVQQAAFMELQSIANGVQCGTRILKFKTSVPFPRWIKEEVS